MLKESFVQNKQQRNEFRITLAVILIFSLIMLPLASDSVYAKNTNQSKNMAIHFYHEVGNPENERELVDSAGNAIHFEDDASITANLAKLSDFDVNALDLKQPKAMATDQVTGEIFILDLSGPQLVRIIPEADGSLLNASVIKIQLESFEKIKPKCLAFNGETDHLYTLGKPGVTLYEFTKEGEIVARSDLKGTRLKNPKSLLFAQSSDKTDKSSDTSLYVLDSAKTGADIVGAAEPTGAVIELSFFDPASLAAPTTSTVLTNTINTSNFTPNPSPDPAGVEYMPSLNRLIISDSEVDEIPLLWGKTHANLFETDLRGNVIRTSGTRDRAKFTGEPSGIAYDSAGKHLYISDDDKYLILNVNLGTNGLYDNKDPFTAMDTAAFDCFDPEGVAFDSLSGTLYIVDGTNEEIYAVQAGSNGIIEGFSKINGVLTPIVDDCLSQFDTSILGVHDPEGIAFDADTGNLYVCGLVPNNAVAEITVDGTLVQMIDISAAKSIKRSGLGIGPSSTDPSVKSLYLADRGLDNNTVPNENDGRIFELSMVFGSSYTVTFTSGENGSLEGQSVFSGIAGGSLWSNAITVPTPNPSQGYHFADWTPSFPEQVDQSETYTANFAINQYNLTYQAESNGRIDGENQQTVTYGANGTEVTAVPDSGYRFNSWSDGLTTPTRTDLNIQSDLSVTASFISDQIVIRTTEIPTYDDAFVKSNYPTINYGAMANLDMLQSSTVMRRAYLQFNVKDLTGSVKSAQLRLYTSGPSSEVMLYSVSNYYQGTTTLWKESGLKWINAPSLPEYSSSTGAASGGAAWVAFDVGNIIQGNGLYSFALTSSSKNLTQFNSSEALQYQPVLVIVTTEGGSN